MDEGIDVTVHLIPDFFSQRVVPRDAVAVIELVGNLMVSFSVGMTFVFGGIVVDRGANFGVWWFGAIAVLLDLGEEIAADAMDAEGDSLIHT